MNISSTNDEKPTLTLMSENIKTFTKEEKNISVLLQRALLILGKIVFSGTLVSRRKMVQLLFNNSLENVNIEKVNKMSRKQKYISYNRIKICVTRIVYQEKILNLLKEGKTDDIFNIIKTSGKFVHIIIVLNFYSDFC